MSTPDTNSGKLTLPMNIQNSVPIATTSSGNPNTDTQMTHTQQSTSTILSSIPQTRLDPDSLHSFL